MKRRWGKIRKLAHIERIEKHYPIGGKDRIALAAMENLGWQVIVQKDQCKIGDLVVYCEIDSVLPDKPEFDFLKDKRIRTMKMSGVRSEGICFPLSILPEGNYIAGDDVTEIIGIKQFEGTMDVENDNIPNIPEKKYPKWLMQKSWFRKLVLPKKASKGFPSFISKTDETRVQNATFYLNLDAEYVATEKVDGQSGSFCLVRQKAKNPFGKDKFEYMVCSRNLRLWNKDNSSYWNVSDKYNIEDVLRKLIGDNDWVAIQGECVASNVQGNKYKVKEPDLYVFNLIYPTGRIGSLEAKRIVEEHNMKFVPIIDEKISLKGMTVNDVLDYATDKSQLFDTLREGVVFRSLDGKHSFKTVSPEFLMKNKE